MPAGNAETLQHIEFALRFDAFGDDLCSSLTCVIDQSGDQCPSGQVLVDIAGQAHVKFEEIWVKLQDMTQGGVTCARIINSELHTGLPVGGDSAA